MVSRRYDGPRGRVAVVEHESCCLEGNPLKDPWRRRVAVYLPHDYERSDRRYPVLFDLVGFTGSGLAHIGWRNFSENVPERLDRLIGSGDMGEVIVVFPDCFTALGGNQYINSTALGPYEDYLVEELVPFIDERFRTLSDRRHRGVFGKSSGGYGSLVHAMRHADVWGAAACHSGDMYFEFAYQPDFPKALDVLARHDHSVSRFLDDFRSREKHSDDEVHCLMFIAMAATYDPDTTEPLGFHLPVDPRTGELRPGRWQRWLAHDPVRLVDDYASELKRLALLYIDCGSRDQYHLHYGARILHDKLTRAGVTHYYEEFDDNHSSIDYRLNTSLPMLWKAIRAGE